MDGWMDEILIILQYFCSLLNPLILLYTITVDLVWLDSSTVKYAIWYHGAIVVENYKIVH